MISAYFIILAVYVMTLAFPLINMIFFLSHNVIFRHISQL